MEKDFIFSEFVLNYGIIWELEKIGNSDLLYQALKKQEEKSENSYHPPTHFSFSCGWPGLGKSVYFFEEANFSSPQNGLIIIFG